MWSFLYKLIVSHFYWLYGGPIDCQSYDGFSWNWFLSTGPCGRTVQLLSGRATLAARFAEPGSVFLGSPALPHSGVRFPAALLSTSIPPVLTVLFPESRHRLPAFTGPLSVHQFPPSAPAGSVAFPALALRGRGASVAVTPRSEFRSAAGVSGRSAAAPSWTGWRSSGARWRSSGNARSGSSRSGWHSGEFNHFYIYLVLFIFCTNIK